MTASLAVQQANAIDAAQCQYEARQWADSVWHINHRIKVPIWTAVGWLIAGPAVGAFAGILAANAESPRERRMIWAYEQWCYGGKVGEHPEIPPRWLELF